MNEQIFKEYDIRGIFETDFNEQLIKKIGYHIGLEIIKQTNEKKVCVGYDCRTHSPQTFKWLISGLNHANIEITCLGEIPTPLAYFSGYDKNLNIKSNIMITASHNPKEYNGLKFTINNKSFFGEQIQKLKNKVLNNTQEISDNHTFKTYDITTPYIKYISEKFKHLTNLNQKFIFDCGNGMVGPVLEKILDNLDIEYEIIYKEPNGEFPNHPADPSKEENLKEIIKEQNNENIKLGFAYDGDGDRLYSTLQTGQINPDLMAIIIAKTIKNPKVAGEVKCSKLMYDEINKIGQTTMCRNGRSNLQDYMSKNPDTTFGIELSGHSFFKDRYFGYDDAIYATFRTIELIYKKIDIEKELKNLPKIYSTKEFRIKVPESKKQKITKEFNQKIKNSNLPYTNLIEIDGTRAEFENGWGLVRASNTGPELSVRYEANNKENLEKIQTKLSEILNQIIKENQK